MALGRRFNLSESGFRKAALALMIAYVIAIQLPLLSPYRLVPVDEIVHVDAAYGISSGRSLVPAGWFWSHTIPETGTFFAAYTPFYLYLQAFVLRLVGFSPLSIGLLHCTLRLAAAAIFYLICRKVTGALISSFFVTIWATLAVGPTGRYEDLAVVFLLGSAYLLVEPRRKHHKFWLVGLLIGLAFLSYPAPLAVLLPICLVLFFHSQGNRLSEIQALAKKYLQIVLAAAVISATWFFWIIPYWHEFKVHFLEFAVPDALAPSYTKSLTDLIRYVVGGFLTSPFPLHYSLLPIAGFLGALIVLDAKRNGSSFRTVLAIALPLVVAALTARVRIHKTYNLIWLIVTILVLLPILWGRVFTKQRRFASASPAAKALISLLVIVIGFQLTAHLILAGLSIVGDIAAVDACGEDPHFQLVNLIPPGDRVVTNSAEIFYRVRQRNPVYWPSGLQGKTPGGVPFSTSYDDSFRWLALTRSLAEDDLIEKHNPGGKFRWDTETFDYFRAHYTLVGTSDLAEECDLLRGLSRFSGMPRSLYLYQRNEDVVHGL